MLRAGVVLASLLLLAPSAEATGPVVAQSLCVFSWVAPQANTNSSNLNDLKEYRIYAGPTAAAAADPALVNVATVAAPEQDPPAGKTAAWPCKVLAPGQWFITVTAADTSGNESTRPVAVPFVSQDDVTPQAPSGLQVGP